MITPEDVKREKTEAQQKVEQITVEAIRSHLEDHLPLDPDIPSCQDLKEDFSILAQLFEKQNGKPRWAQHLDQNELCCREDEKPRWVRYLDRNKLCFMSGFEDYMEIPLIPYLKQVERFKELFKPFAEAGWGFTFLETRVGETNFYCLALYDKQKDSEEFQRELRTSFAQRIGQRFQPRIEPRKPWYKRIFR